jgi:uncharacterized phage-associated protein
MAKKKKITKKQIRIPSFLNRDKYIHSILFFLEKINNPYLGKTKLMKLLYFLDFGFYENHGVSITNDKYVWYPHGPYPSRVDTVLDYMERNKLIERSIKEFGIRRQERYMANEKFNRSYFSSEEMRAIERVAIYFEDYSTQEIEDEAHRDIPWLLSKPEDGKKVGGYIDYKLALYRHNSLPSTEDEKETDILSKSRKFRELVDRTLRDLE